MGQVVARKTKRAGQVEGMRFALHKGARRAPDRQREFAGLGVGVAHEKIGPEVEEQSARSQYIFNGGEGHAALGMYPLAKFCDQFIGLVVKDLTHTVPVIVHHCRT